MIGHDHIRWISVSLEKKGGEGVETRAQTREREERYKRVKREPGAIGQKLEKKKKKLDNLAIRPIL